MKILYLAHRIPYPPNKGDKIRSFNEIKYLSQKHEIHLACLADDPRDIDYEKDLRQYCRTTKVLLINPKFARAKSTLHLFSGKPLSVFSFYSRKLQKSIDHLLSTINFDVIFCYSSQMAEYVFRSKLLDSGFLKLLKMKHQQRESSIQQPESRNQQPETSNQHPASSIQHPASSNKHPASSNQNPSTSSQQPKLIMDFVDVDSEKWKQYSNYEKWPLSWIYALESKRLAAYEKRVAVVFDHGIFVTSAEKKMFRTKNPQINHISVITNGVDLDYFSPSFSGSSSTHLQSNDLHSTLNIQHSTLDISDSTLNTQHPSPSTQAPIIIFTGAMDYYANVDGVLWFAKEILPLIKKRIPDVEFNIVGSRPAREVCALANNNGIKVTGYVPDTREYFRKAMVAVVPLRIAQGIQNKILEPMAMGIPVVATPIAFQGIGATKDRDLIVERDAGGFANSVVKLLRSIGLREQFSRNARRAIENNHNWTKNLAQIDSILEGSVTGEQ